MSEERPLSALAVYSARPIVRVDGTEHDKVSELVIGMVMTERDGGLSALELRLSNIASDPQGDADFAFEDDRLVRLGGNITIQAGDEEAPQEIFRGIVTGMEADFRDGDPPELVVLAEDAFQQARMARRTKVHENVTIADLARDLAGQLGLQPVVTGFSEPIGVRMQLNESDLAFLRRLLARYDGDLQVVGNELHVSPRGDVQRDRVTLELNGQLRSARVVADLAHQATEVTVTGWDPVQGQRVTATSRGANLGPGSGRTGAQVLQGAVGARSEQAGHLAVLTNTEAQALADAVFDHHARRFVRVEATVEGNPGLRVGTHVTLSGLGPRFDNTYYVTRASHRWDVQGGYETDFEAECAYWGQG